MNMRKNDMCAAYTYMLWCELIHKKQFQKKKKVFKPMISFGQLKNQKLSTCLP